MGNSFCIYFREPRDGGAFRMPDKKEKGKNK
jgi:hypothetical protein